MCLLQTERALKESGVQTKILFCAPEECAALLAQVAPHCRAALIFDEGGGFVAERYRSALSAFRPACFCLSSGDCTPLFSLEGEFRAAVGIGERSMAAARFFATLRGCACLLVPLRPSAEGAFGAAAPPPFAGYPLKDADFFAPCAEFLREDAESIARAGLSALCAEELRCDALFSGRERDPSPFDAAASLAAEGGAQRVLCASVLFSLALRGAPPFACTEALFALRRKDARFSAFALFSAFAARYAALSAIRPRPYYVPDYAGRVSAAARLSGVSAKRLFSFLRVPGSERSFAFSRTFCECRARLGRGGELLSAFAKRLSASYFAAGGGACRAERARAEEAYAYAAELSPLLSPPALERELGACTLPHMKNGAYVPEKTVQMRSETYEEQCR